MESYDVGRVFSRMFEMVRINFWAVAGFVLLATLVSFAISLLSLGSMFAAIGEAVQTGGLGSDSALQIAAASQSAQASPLYWVGQLIGLVVASAILAGCVDACLRSNRGESASFSTSWAAALNYCLPVFGFMILYILAISAVVTVAALIGVFVAGWLGVLIGLAAVLVLGSMLVVALPALVNGDAGVFGSFGRSVSLTKGHLGIIVVSLILFVLMLFALMLVVVLVLGLFGIVLAKISPVLLILMIVPYVALLIAYQLLASGSMTAIYAELRDIKEGGDSALGDVFA